MYQVVIIAAHTLPSHGQGRMDVIIIKTLQLTTVSPIPLLSITFKTLYKFFGLVELVMKGRGFTALVMISLAMEDIMTNEVVLGKRLN